MLPERLSSFLGIVCIALLQPFAAYAQSVALTGVLGKKALLVIDGAAPQVLGMHESANGVQVLQVDPHSAVVQIQGQRQTLQLGASPTSVGKGLGGPRRLVMRADGHGHFRPAGHINNKPIQYMVDTGASVIGLSQAEAQRVGIDYEQQGRPVMMNTANGRVQGWMVRLQSVRVGDLLVHGVEAVVTPQPMPYVLLGNSFLSQVHMTRNGSEMILEQR